MWNRCKVEQAKCAEQAGANTGAWNQWRCYMESYENNANWRRTTYRWRNPTYRDICWIPKCYRLQRLWSSTVLDIDDHLLCSDVHMEVGKMYDGPWRSFQMLQQNVNQLIVNVKRKKIMHSQQTTMHDMFKQQNMNLDFCQKNCSLNKDVYLNGCVLKREIIVLHWNYKLELWDGFAYTAHLPTWSSTRHAMDNVSLSTAF